ncbi:MAG: alkaline phosphatase family protein [Bacteroidales bacterium]|nr:alkaline phosphatase family protein [Bacteroidales bacterium]
MSIKLNIPLNSRLAGVLAASIVTMSLSVSAAVPQRPALVVGVMIDGLSMEYLELLKGYFGEGGFKRLLDNGVTISDIDYGTIVDAPTATAIAFTGAVPAVNGVGSSHVYNSETRSVNPVFHDPETLGNYTDDTVSPTQLLVSTLGDELRIDTGGLGYVYSIAPDQGTALILAGHAGNSGTWIDDVTGNWATTTFYHDTPRLLQQRNRMQPLSVRLDTISWTNFMAPDRYPDIPAHKKAYPMRNTFLRKDTNRFKAFKTAAPVNSEVVAVAGEYLNTLSLGTRDVTDMLNLGFTVQPYEFTNDADGRIEQMDLYLRLDNDLAKLFNTIDSTIGLDKTLVFVVGTPRRARSRRDDEKWAIPHGEFSPRRAMALLNVYLIAKHGNGDWVNGYHDRQIFLNHELIKKNDLDEAAIRTDVAQFLTRMAGVTDAYTLEDIINLKAGVNPQAVRNNTVIERAGDVLIQVAPGWEITDQGSDLSLPLVERSGVTTAPAFLLAPELATQVIDRPVDARVLAPTVASILRIRSPNGASLPRLQLAKNK